MATVESSRDEVLREAKERFGLVPEWLNKVPDSALQGYWRLMRDFYFAETAIPNKYKDLIGLAVAGATRCRYCALFHTEGARLAGATDAEIAEASMMGGVTMLASTFVQAEQIDYDKFVEETRQLVNFVKSHAKAGPRAEAHAK